MVIPATNRVLLCVFLRIFDTRRCPRQSDATIGLSLMDRFTSAMLDFFQAAITKGKDVTANRVRGFSSESSAPLNLRDDVGLFETVVFFFFH